LDNVDLSEARLTKVKLNDARLVGANLFWANLSHADLRDANLSEANLDGTKLSDAHLEGMILKRANLVAKDLSGLNLSLVNFQNAKLQTARLLFANLDNSILTGANLWETQRAGWSIKGVICEYVYWDKDAKEKTVYTPGEFERLFTDQTKIRLFYKDGITPLEIATLPALIQHLEEMQGCALRFVSISEGAGGAIVELAIENTEDLSTERIETLTRSIKESAERDIQILRSALKGKEDEIKLLTGKVEGFKESISLILRGHQGDMIIGNKYEISGQTGAVGDNSQANDITFNQTVNQGDDQLFRRKFNLLKFLKRLFS
jgi:hypothetical protein